MEHIAPLPPALPRREAWSSSSRRITSASRRTWRRYATAGPASPTCSSASTWFAFGSIDHIGKFAAEYGWDAIVETGDRRHLHRRRESKFAGEHGYDKRDEYRRARGVRAAARHGRSAPSVPGCAAGTSTTASTSIEDLNYFVSLYPTYQQLTRVSPFPGDGALGAAAGGGAGAGRAVGGRPLLERRPEEPSRLETHETLNLVRAGLRPDVPDLGPVDHAAPRRAARRLRVLPARTGPVLRKHKSKLFKQQCVDAVVDAAALRALRPERHRCGGAVRKIDDKYRPFIGEPTPVMKTMAAFVEKMAIAARLKEQIRPRQPAGQGGALQALHLRQAQRQRRRPVPHRVARPAGSGLSGRDQVGRVIWKGIRLACEAARELRFSEGDPDIDRFLLDRLKGDRFGVGF